LLIAKTLRKKIIVVAGGFDVAKYGSMSSIWKSVLVKLMLKFSDKILAVSNSNKNEIINNCKIDQSKIEMIYHGFEELKQICYDKKINSIVTIGYIDKLSYSRKGIDRFFKLAELLTEVEFHLIGRIDSNLENISIPKNVTLHGHLNLHEDKFTNLMESAKIYVQFSRHESFGCSIAEAMQYGCIPVVSNCYSLPEVSGNCGLIINNFDNFEQIATQVRELLEGYNEQLALKCMERVGNVFSYEKRADKILSIIKSIKLDSSLL
jgi:glycosyltransferase involved in cell wall biosynthesis